MFDIDHSAWDDPYNEKQRKPRGGWVENEDGRWSYLIRMHGDTYFRSKHTVTKQEAFKYILMGDKKGIENGN